MSTIPRAVLRYSSIHILNQNFVSVASWVAHVGGRVTHMIERQGMLVTIGEEDNIRSAVMKIWNLSKIDKRSSGPSLLRSAKVQPSGKPHPVSCFALTPDLAFLAIGLADGTVLLYRHLDQSLASTSGSLTILPKPRVIHEIPTEPVTFLGFTSSNPTSLSPTTGSSSQDAHNAPPNPSLYLLIVTTSSTYSYPLIPKVSSPSSVLVDEIGAGLQCACIDWKGRWVTLGRDEALYACAVGGRIGSYALEGEKKSLRTHLNYVVVVLPAPFPPITTTAPVGNQRKLGAGSAGMVASPTSGTLAGVGLLNSSSGEVGRVVLVDMENKLVAYSGNFEGGVRDVISAWGHVYVVGNEGKLTRLIEKPTPDKLSLLYAKNLYSLAFSVAQTQGLDTTDVHRHHGDHLYSRGDFEGAMREYINTIGGVQASYVIRKFLTARLTPLLMTYLQELHARGLAHAEHTTLLLNAYAKAGDVARLDSFVRSEGRVFRGEGPGSVSRVEDVAPGDGLSKEPPFELDTAIRVCRQAGFFAHAAYLARRWGRHDDYLRVLVEDVGGSSVELTFGSTGRGTGAKSEKGDERKMETNGYSAAVSYLREAGGDCAESGLARYGRALLDHLPEETTQLLIDLCTIAGHLPESSPPDHLPATHAKAPSYLSYLALSRAPAVPPALSAGDEALVAKPPGQDKGAGTGGHVRAATASPGPAQVNGGTQAIRRPSPTLFFAHFVDHTTHFVRFLEMVARRRWGQSLEGAIAVEFPGSEDDEAERRDQAAVWNTLLELYLTENQNEGDKEKALRLLRSSHLPYDATHALILCSSYSYAPGLVLLWEKMGMYEDVLRFWMDQYNSGVRAVAEAGDSSHARVGILSSPTAQVIAALRQYGPGHPHLYPLVLRFLTSTPELLSTHQADLQEILEHVEREHIMAPLSVVQVLSRNNVASVGLVKGWLMRRIAEGQEEIATDKQLISSYRSETQAKLKQIDELKDTEHPRVFHVTRCSQCNGQLDLPSIHFMCNHSFHQRCLLGSEATCPLCERQHGVIQEIRRNNERLADQHELFFSEVRENGFRAVASGFGRGWL
ncbi:hypothetical protein F5J12DRAFT_903240 [Pisolithus orientalis]|uniref:uncharacterized protein n=1 Tax=Pisolithus orientalis TaxID=936130 RepID=UPI002224192D|nr:uncharacterized protein F5J12DRAFT_903240 [Pisolithus orientalis]KAI6030894.1 hypothetical protein F5J12DRAFT_903240 [Pisolithus orientalis]